MSFARLATFAAMLFAFSQPVFSQESLMREVIDPKTNSYAEVTALFSSLPANGFVPVRVTLSNHTPQDRKARFNCISNDGGNMYGGDGMKMDSSFEVSAPSGQTVTRDLIVPVATVLNVHSYSGATLRVEMRGDFGSADGSLSSPVPSAQKAVLLSNALHTKNGSSLDSAVGSSSHGRGEFAGSFQPGMLPDDWRAYSGYDVILMTDTDWRATTNGARRAIQQWLRMGGYLRIYQTGSTQVMPDGLDLTPDPNITGTFLSSAGKVEFKNIPADLTMDTKVVKELEEPSLLPQQAKEVQEFFSNGKWSLQTLFGQQGFKYGIFLVVLIAFAIVVGPVNLFVFAKSNQRHRLFITTPLISLVASILLIALIFFQDGLGGRGMRTILCEVRPEAEENLAYLTQEQFSRTGVLFGTRFKIDNSTVLSPVPINETPWARLTNGYGKGNGAYSIQAEDGGTQRVSGDWFKSRSEQGQVLKSVIPTRGRLEAVPNTTKPTLFSTFDFPLETVVLRTADGKAYRTDNLTAGHKVELTEISEADYRAFLKEQSLRFSERNSEIFDRLAARKGHYVALSRNAPGIETYRSIRWSETNTVLTGPLAR